MEDFNENSEYSDAGSERSIDPDNVSDIQSMVSVNELEDLLQDNEQNKIRHDQLMEDKYNAVLEFNAGYLDADIYFASINKINEELEQIDYVVSATNRALIEHELNFKELLDDYVSKINKVRGINKKVTKDFLDYFDVQRIKALRYLIDELQSKYIEKPDEYVPTDSSDLEHTFEKELESNEKDLMEKGIYRPIPEKYQNESDYSSALSGYYEQAYIFLHFRKYEQN